MPHRNPKRKDISNRFRNAVKDGDRRMLPSLYWRRERQLVFDTAEGDRRSSEGRVGGGIIQ